MTWIDSAVQLSKKFEGCSLTAYPDAGLGWKVPTIGYGATGPSIIEGTVWSQSQADEDLINRMTTIGGDIDSVVTVSINENQKAALCDFIYNIGLHAFEESTLLRLLNAGNYSAAAAQFSRWVYQRGQILPGLVARRNQEAALFNTPINT